MNTFEIGLDAWVIQDGNYSDFSSHQEINFAIALIPDSLKPSSNGSPRLERIGPALYSVHGSIEFIHTETWVVNIGILSYVDAAPAEELRSFSWVSGTAYLEVDPYPYFEYLKNLSGIPALTYRWRILNIKLETTPWIETGRLKTRDNSKTSFQDINKTDARNDDEGSAHYLLECELLGSAENN